MELLLQSLYSLLTPQVVAGLLGGTLGAMISIKIELYGWRLTILFGIASIISAGALTEFLVYQTGVQFILPYFVLGTLVGVVGNAAIDALNLASVDFTRKLVDILSNGILEIAKEIPKLIVRKIEDIFKWLVIFFKKGKADEE